MRVTKVRSLRLCGQELRAELSLLVNGIRYESTAMSSRLADTAAARASLHADRSAAAEALADYRW